MVEYEISSRALTSKQSETVDSYESFIDNYKRASRDISDTSSRPTYWGGYSFKPYYFEFWQGHDKRINKREVCSFKNDKWENYFLQP